MLGCRQGGRIGQLIRDNLHRVPAFLKRRDCQVPSNGRKETDCKSKRSLVPHLSNDTFPIGLVLDRWNVQKRGIRVDNLIKLHKPAGTFGPILSLVLGLTAQ